MQREYPHAPFHRTGKGGDIDILIAGCGTGRHSIGVAQQFERSKVLAIDLSAASLGYAKARTGALGVTNIDYAQADILQLGSIGRTFDMIQSAGVLHHLADPWAGWRVLLSLLRPGGVMFVALYSETARRDVVAARAFIARTRLRIGHRGYPRRARRDDDACGRFAAEERGVVQRLLHHQRMPRPAVPRAGAPHDPAGDQGLPRGERPDVPRLRGGFPRERSSTRRASRPTGR